MWLPTKLESFQLPSVLQPPSVWHSNPTCLIAPGWTTAQIFYWKGAIKNLDAEADAFELAFVQQEGFGINKQPSVCDPMNMCCNFCGFSFGIIPSVELYHEEITKTQMLDLLIVIMWT